MDILETQDSANKYNCLICDYHTNKKSNLKQHFVSVKHTTAENGNLKKPTNKQLQHVCVKCGHQYSSKSGLWKHSAKCNKKDNNKLLFEIIKKSEDMNNFLMEQNKQLMEIIQSNKFNTN